MITVHYRVPPVPFVHLAPPTRALFRWLCGYYAEQLETACDGWQGHPEDADWLEGLRHSAVAIRRGQGTLEDFELARDLRQLLPVGYEDGGIALCLLALPLYLRITDSTEGALFCAAMRAVRPVDREWAAEEIGATCAS